MQEGAFNAVSMPSCPASICSLYTIMQSFLLICRSCRIAPGECTLTAVPLHPVRRNQSGSISPSNVAFTLLLGRAREWELACVKPAALLEQSLNG